MFLIVGQRGTGKSQLARQFAPGSVIDLDDEILRRTGRDPRAWIENEGEDRFREVEKQTLRALLTATYKTPPWIVLGAGFELDDFDWSIAKFEMIHWRRVTDAWGRIFTDRPRLNAKVDPLTEYLERYGPREERFRRYADWILEWPEGEHLNSVSRAGAMLAAAPLPVHSGIYTLRATDRERASVILERFVNFGFQAFELRTDLLTDADLAFWQSRLPAERILFAERRAEAKRPADGDVFFGTDWALEWGKPPAGYSIWSNHGGSESTFPTQAEGVHLKWSPLIETFRELERGYRWQQQNPAHRSFLPRSIDGRWTWFRLWMKSRQKLNFLREVENAEAPDQPSFLEFLDTPTGDRFAAILGDPVAASWTPGVQAEFFAARGMPVLRIAIASTEESDEWPEAIEVLRQMGLVAAAVTSPLKLKAFASAKDLTPEARELESVNTLRWGPAGWHGHNTDAEGLRESLRAENLLSSSNVRIYGGGGTLAMLAAIFPRAARYSLRTQSLRPESPPAGESGGLFIWAAGPNEEPPRFEVAPDVVLDLNYRQDSNARAFALLKGARYVDGSGMFLAQAAGQRRFWSAHERE